MDNIGTLACSGHESVLRLLVQLLNGLAGASSLFLVAAGLSLIFGVTRIVNFAHGSFYMLGIYIAYTRCRAARRRPLGFWPALLVAALAVGCSGALVEVLLLRRIYHAPELFQLLATFALVLVIKDAVLWLWGPEDCWARARPVAGAVEILGRRFPVRPVPDRRRAAGAGPAVAAAARAPAGARWCARPRRTARWWRARRQPGLAVHRVFALGAMLAGLGGALQLPREPANLELDLHTIGEAFVVVVVGGMGSIPGAYLAALLIAEVKALCVWIWAGRDVRHRGLVLQAHAGGRVPGHGRGAGLRPWGLLGRRRRASATRARRPRRRCVHLVAWHVGPQGHWCSRWRWCPAGSASSYARAAGHRPAGAALFAASLHFIMGPAACTRSATRPISGWRPTARRCWCGVPACRWRRRWHWRRWWRRRRGAVRLVRGAAVGGVPGHADAGVRADRLGHRVPVGWPHRRQQRPHRRVAGRMAGGQAAYYAFTLVLVLAGMYALRRVLFSPFGYAMRAGRDSPLRADAIGIDVKHVQWVAFIVAGALPAWPGRCSPSPRAASRPRACTWARAVDGLVMVLLGGVQTLAGPVVGAVSFTWLHDTVARNTEYWRAMLGGIVLVLVLLFPQGIAGQAERWLARLPERWR
jgi:branched-chain amino acid transport system permease protein